MILIVTCTLTHRRPWLLEDRVVRLSHSVRGVPARGRKAYEHIFQKISFLDFWKTSFLLVMSGKHSLNYLLLKAIENFFLYLRKITHFRGLISHSPLNKGTTIQASKLRPCPVWSTYLSKYSVPLHLIHFQVQGLW